MKRVLVIYILFSFTKVMVAQEVRFGIVGGTAPIKKVELTLDQHTPSNSYYTYLEEDIGEGLINEIKVFSSFHFGAIFNLSYKRFSFNLEPQYYFERSTYNFRATFHTMKRIIGAKGFRMPFYFAYKFFKKETSSYVLFGLNVIKETNWDIQHPGEGYYFEGEAAYGQINDFGDDHFENVLYDELAYTALNVGFGKQFKRINASIRFQKPIGKITERLPVKNYRAEFTLSWLFLSTKDFTNKHPLYVD